MNGNGSQRGENKRCVLKVTLIVRMILNFQPVFLLLFVSLFVCLFKKINNGGDENGTIKFK